MSASRDQLSRSRIRPREGEHEEKKQRQRLSASSLAPSVDGGCSGSVPIPTSSANADSTTTAVDVATSSGVQPLPGQFSQRKRPRRSPRLACHMDRLAVVELQLVMQYLEVDGKLQMARCSHRLLHAADHSFAWQGAPPFIVECCTAAGVERIRLSLLRFAPIQLRCIGMDLLDCIAPAVPHLYGLDLHKSSEDAAASLAQLLQHPCAERLESLEMTAGSSSRLPTVALMHLICRLPQLRILRVCLPGHADASAALLQPLGLARPPALTELAIKWANWTDTSDALLDAIGQVGVLDKLILGCLQWQPEHLRRFFTAPNIRGLQHLGMTSFTDSLQPQPDLDAIADEYRAAFGAMQQLQSLSLHHAFGVALLLPHLAHAKQLRQLDLICAGTQGTTHPLPHRSTHPSRASINALLTAAPQQLEVHLLLPASLQRFMALGSRAIHQQQWNELLSMGADMERVTVIHHPGM